MGRENGGKGRRLRMRANGFSADRIRRSAHTVEMCINTGGGSTGLVRIQNCMAVKRPRNGKRRMVFKNNWDWADVEAKRELNRDAFSATRRPGFPPPPPNIVR